MAVLKLKVYPESSPVKRGLKIKVAAGSVELTAVSFCSHTATVSMSTSAGIDSSLPALINFDQKLIFKAT